jgi:hypothetical protein
MPIISKTYNVAAGSLNFNFTYASLILQDTLDDFDIKNIDNLNKGIDTENNIDLSVYPANIDISVDDLSGDNYKKLSKLMQHYNITYPYNFDIVLKLEIILNGKVLFKGFLDEIESNKDNWELTLKFIDGVNKYKDVNIGNPYALKKLWDNNVIKGYRLGTSDTVAYGFSTMSYINYSAEPERSGYFVNDIQDGDKSTNMAHTIVQLFKLLNENIELELDVRILFRDVLTGSEQVDFARLYVRRILSNLLGRYVVIKKGQYPSEKMAYLNGNPDYTREQYFEVVYEDTEYKVFRHTFSGTVGSNKWEMGTDAGNVGELLKKLAYNFFCDFGFKDDRNNAYFRHRRPVSNSQALTDIISMTKLLSVDKVESVRIDDYYSDNYAKDGNDYGTEDYRKINYKIPLNTFRTGFSYEYRMSYLQSGTERRVIYFKDLETGFEDLPMEVISRAEWLAHRNFRDKYEFELYGIDYTLDSTYSVDQYNYKGKFKPVEISKDLMRNRTIMKAIQIDN